MLNDITVRRSLSVLNFPEEKGVGCQQLYQQGFHAAAASLNLSSSLSLARVAPRCFLRIKATRYRSCDVISAPSPAGPRRRLCRSSRTFRQSSYSTGFNEESVEFEMAHYRRRERARSRFRTDSLGDLSGLHQMALKVFTDSPGFGVSRVRCAMWSVFRSTDSASRHATSQGEP